MTLQVPGNHSNRQGILKNVILGTKMIKIGPLVPDLDFQMSKKRYYHIPKAKSGPNGPILMFLRPNITFLSMPCQIEWFPGT